MEMKVLLFDNPNGYAFLFLEKINIENCELFVLAQKDNIYNSNWPDIDESNIIYYESFSFLRGIKLSDGNYLKNDFLKKFDKIITFTHSGLVFLRFRNFKSIYYNIGGFKDFYFGHRIHSFGVKYFYKFFRSLIFKVSLLKTESIIVSNQMDFDHVFKSFFGFKIKFLPIFVQRWTKHIPSFDDTVNFVHFSSQSFRLKNNPAIFNSLSELKSKGVKFKLHIFLWGIDVEKTREIIKNSNFRDDVIINQRIPIKDLSSYVNSLSRVFVLGEFSEYTGPGSGGAIRETSSAGIPSISYVKKGGFSIEPTSCYLNSNELNLTKVLYKISNYNKEEYFALCNKVYDEFSSYYDDSKTNLILKNILNEIH